MTRHPFLVVVASVGLVSCSSSSLSVQPASTPSPASSSTPSPTVPVSAVPSTTGSTTGTPSTTMSPVVAGWRVVDPATITGQWAPPCCASNWYGVPSPALPAAGGELADGVYAVEAPWGDDVSAPMSLVVHRFEHCAVLPADACQDEGPNWPADVLGVDRATGMPMTVPLDGQLRVVLTGLAGRDADMNLMIETKEAQGGDLATLATAVEQSFASLLLAPLAAGTQPTDIIAQLNAAPQGGFGPALDGSPSGLSFTSGEAPALLFQAPFRYEDPAASRGTDVLQVISAEVVAGALTLYVYAGYYP